MTTALENAASVLSDRTERHNSLVRNYTHGRTREQQEEITAAAIRMDSAAFWLTVAKMDARNR